MLLALLLSSLLWWLAVPLLVALASVLLQEAARLAFYHLYECAFSCRVVLCRGVASRLSPLTLVQARFSARSPQR
jgi:hypothetical protein